MPGRKFGAFLGREITHRRHDRLLRRLNLQPEARFWGADSLAIDQDSVLITDRTTNELIPLSRLVGLKLAAGSSTDMLILIHQDWSRTRTWTSEALLDAGRGRQAAEYIKVAAARHSVPLEIIETSVKARGILLLLPLLLLLGGVAFVTVNLWISWILMIAAIAFVLIPAVAHRIRIGKRDTSVANAARGRGYPSERVPR